MLRKTIIPKEIYFNLKFGKWKMEKIHNFEEKKTDFNWYSFGYGQSLVTKLVVT